MVARRKKTCFICKKKFESSQLFPVQLLSNPFFETLSEEESNISRDDLICHKDMGIYRAKYMEKIVRRRKNIITEKEQSVIESFKERNVLSENIEDLYEEKASFSGRIADQFASFVGSWSFIISFITFLATWVILNSLILVSNPLDRYPYILLNLLLSTIAALQAPLIMMSQNRQEAKDRIRAEHEYKINLKAELEIRHLNAKIDRFMHIV